MFRVVARPPHAAEPASESAGDLHVSCDVAFHGNSCSDERACSPTTFAPRNPQKCVSGAYFSPENIIFMTILDDLLPCRTNRPRAYPQHLGARPGSVAHGNLLFFQRTKPAQCFVKSTPEIRPLAPPASVSGQGNPPKDGLGHKIHHMVRRLVRLRQHRHARLHQNLVACELRHL